MKRENFTAARVTGFQCAPNKKQSIFWDGKTPGLGLRVTAAGSKAFIFETRLNGQTIRMTIGDPRNWTIGDAQAEASRLKVMTDQGIDPRQVIADAIAAKETKAAALVMQDARESVTVAEAWQAYVTERSAAKIDGKPVWGEKHKAHHAYFVQAGGVKRKRGTRPGESKKTRPGVLVPLMKLRLSALDADVMAAWLDKETKQAPTTAAQAFRAFRAFLTWCAKHKTYSAAVQAGTCQSDDVKNRVPSPKIKKDDSLRKAQIKPWFEAVRKIGNPVIAVYLQGLLLTGARRNELATLRWHDVDFQWKSLTIRDKVEGERTIPLTPYLEHLIAALPRRNEFVFSSQTAASGRVEEPRIQHVKALKAAALPALSLHGLRRSFGTLSEWVEVPAGIVAQIMGHKPSAIAEKHYIQRELDLLHLWHVKIETWILEQAGVKFDATQAKPGLHAVK
ncbi:Prophage integrase IntF [Candidatus Nitrotoga sp. HW29]|uniref:integrase family protein n=1 Tax=Candidatus Nitrotoga sp. HW29 TaxID=2886963 RepID=UPI001EF22A1F|nr:integrase family protein [Candidatus Nitrotoga sp. HW29]CAH1903698.1 Prophage integrase IntF [Candidatus Nitrotoga sp. HW29]